MTDDGGTTPLVPSDEGDEKGLELGRAQGEALTRTLRHMTEEIAHDGREVQAGEYLVAYAVEEAEGMWVPKDGDLAWSEPGEENAHIEVAVRDAADGRLIPGLRIEATIIDGDGNEIGVPRAAAAVASVPLSLRAELEASGGRRLHAEGPLRRPRLRAP